MGDFRCSAREDGLGFEELELICIAIKSCNQINHICIYAASLQTI